MGFSCYSFMIGLSSYLKLLDGSLMELTDIGEISIYNERISSICIKLGVAVEADTENHKFITITKKGTLKCLKE